MHGSKKKKRHTTGIDTTLIWSESILDIDMIRISEARKDKFLWTDGVHRETQEKCSIALCEENEQKGFRSKRHHQQINSLWNVSIVKFLIRETKTLAR